MAPAPTAHIQTRRGNNVRIGPVSVITLIAVICMAVLAVLAASTSYASATISTRMADSSQMLYDNERAGQEFVASIDGALAAVRSAGGASADATRAVSAALDEACENARAAADGRVACMASIDGTVVTAQFVCEDTRQLNIAITIRDDASYRIDEWKMASAQQEAQVTGSLWAGA